MINYDDHGYDKANRNKYPISVDPLDASHPIGSGPQGGAHIYIIRILLYQLADVSFAPVGGVVEGRRG